LQDFTFSVIWAPVRHRKLGSWVKSYSY